MVDGLSIMVVRTEAHNLVEGFVIGMIEFQSDIYTLQLLPFFSPQGVRKKL